MKPHSSPLIALFSSSDADLARLAVHDRAAFTELYHRHFRRVYRFTLASCASVADAQDVTTQTFLAALEGIAGFRGEANFAAWLLGIARNQTAMFYRIRRRELTLDHAAELPDRAPSPEILAGERLQFDQAMRALRQLPTERAEAITLYLFADLTAAEVGRLMNKSEAAVKMLVYRGLRQLRAQLAPVAEVDV